AYSAQPDHPPTPSALGRSRLGRGFLLAVRRGGLLLAAASSWSRRGPDKIALSGPLPSSLAALRRRVARRPHAAGPALRRLDVARGGLALLPLIDRVRHDLLHGLALLAEVRVLLLRHDLLS